MSESQKLEKERKERDKIEREHCKTKGERESEKENNDLRKIDIEVNTAGPGARLEGKPSFLSC